MPNGDVVLDQSLDLRFNIRKAALALQNRASVTVFGMSQPLREQLLSQFTAWNKRQVEVGMLERKWIEVKLEAGYLDADGVEISAVVFKGQVVLVNLVSAPPDIGITIQCYTRQVDKTTFVSDPAPVTTTLAEYVKWAAGQMGLGDHYLCQTSYNDQVIENPSSGALIIAALTVDIQNARRPDVAAFVDDDFLYVKDRDKIINLSEMAFVTEFVGIPSWTEWGIEFEAMFDTSIRLAHGVDVKSQLNPSIDGQYVLVSIEYDLSSRDTPFYVKAQGAPPSQ
jgi:hypothetical protein